tara:strand:- start:263 stop:1654 length:1392 start_codon:yes stop_codon:yes gene_type:complete
MDKDFLKGKRIAITALELENKEHRGISAVIKSTISILSKYGAEIYLITSFEKIIKSNNKSEKEINSIFIKEIYNFLNLGRDHRNIFNASKKYKFKIIIQLLFSYFILLTNKFLLKYKLYEVENNLNHNTNLKTRYLKKVKGFISVRDIFHLCRLRSMRLLIKDPILNINIKDIDLVISSSPLSIKKENPENAQIIQLIHDALPIQISNHPENPKIFYNRLKDAHKNSNCIYVSEESKKVVRKIINIKGSDRKLDQIIYPMPSLDIELLEKAFYISSMRSINKPYILFNSSIEERKKVENAINYFLCSNLPKRNFLLCIAGKLQENKYCQYIKKISKNHKDILLLDYVSELEKAWLYLNTSLLISTSSSEGFGIPILDALSLNLSSIATKIPSHVEIKKLSKLNNINLLSHHKKKYWIENLNKVKIFELDNNYSKRQRINHYKNMINNLEKNYLSSIKMFLNID